MVQIIQSVASYKPIRILHPIISEFKSIIEENAGY